MVETPYDRELKRHYRIFEQVVTAYFKPIAQKHALPLVKIEGNIYEMPSPYFILRIGVYWGHGSGRDLVVSLRQTTLCAFSERKQDCQYSVGWLRAFGGFKMAPFLADLNTDEGLLNFAQIIANQVERFAVPYLLGQKDDFEAVREFVQEKIENDPSIEKMRRMQHQIERNPKIVKAWPITIPREKGEEWETAKELRVSNIQFLGDLEGDRERILKSQLAEFFKRDQSVKTAYLARMIGPTLPATAAVCLRTRFGFDKGMMEKISKMFVLVFNLQENFNIIFLTDAQESSLAKVCQPFFEKS